MRKLLLSIYFIKIIVILFFKYLSYIGDTSIETQNLILKYFTIEELSQGIEYSRSGFGISLISQFIDIFILVCLVFFNYSEKLELKIQSLPGSLNLFKVSFVFLSIIYLIDFILELPFSYYFDMIIEKQYGFSNMTISSWIILHLKNFFLGYISILLSGMIIIYVLKLFNKIWIFLIPIISLIFSLVFTIIYPIYITPLYYDLEPIKSESLKEKIETLCKKENIIPESIFVIRESEYSNHTNAYFTGWGSQKKIFLYDTLIEKHTEEEIISILGHEIGHWKLNHQWKDMIWGTLALFLGCGVVQFLFNKAKIEGKMGLMEIYSPSTLPYLYMIFGLLNFIATPIGSYMSRMDEADADRISLELTGDIQSAVSTEIKLARDNKSRLNPHPLVEFYYYSHPKAIDRIISAENFQKIK